MSDEQDESKHCEIVFEPGNEERSDATDFNEENASHVKEDSESLREEIIKTDEKDLCNNEEAAMERNTTVKLFDEEKPEETKDRDEMEATDEGGVKKSEIVKEEDNAVFEFFD